jgi:hypothetical protein
MFLQPIIQKEIWQEEYKHFMVAQLKWKSHGKRKWREEFNLSHTSHLLTDVMYFYIYSVKLAFRPVSMIQIQNILNLHFPETTIPHQIC